MHVANLCRLFLFGLGVLFFSPFAHADGIDDFNNSWAGQALSAQRLWDFDLPLADSNIIGTHNSFNSGVYSGPISYLDPNQVDSIYNQLRMGVRSLELDVHWTPKMEDALSFPNRLLLCHGTSIHLGCSTSDRYFTEGLDEILAWLNSAASHDQVLILHIEDHMDGQHGEAYGHVDSRFGHLVYRSGGCGDIPSNLTKGDILAAGKKVVIWNQGACSGDASWNAMVYTGLGAISRVWEDSTTIGGIGGAGAAISAADVTQYFEGGTTVVNLDQLHQNDPRLPAGIWSWDDGEPNDFGGNEDCAAQIAGGRWIDDNCAMLNHFACKHPTTGGWQLSAAADIWAGGVAACHALSTGHLFSRPANSQENQALKQAKEAAGQSRAWLNFHDLFAEGDWVPGSNTDAFFVAGKLTLLGGESVQGISRRLAMGADCNLALFSFEAGLVGGVLWESGTSGQGLNCWTEFQSDGNLVVYDGGGQALWNSGTSGTPDAVLRLQADGNAVIYNGAGLPLWQSNTNFPAEYNLIAGQFSLSPPQILHSQNRKLEMQADCNLVLSSFENGQTGGVVWHSDTQHAGTDCYADFQADGNFVVYDGAGFPLWASGTSGTAGGILSLQADGNLVVYNGAGQPLWTANSNIPAEFTWSAGQFSLGTGQWAQTQGRRLIMQSDCNLVLLNVSNALVGQPLWHSDTSNAGSQCQMDFQADGNLVVYDEFGQAKWASGTSGTAGAELHLQSDGNLVLYNGAGQALWTSSTPGSFENAWFCGDLVCDSTETCSTCAADCGTCGGGGGGTPVPLLSETGLIVLLLILAASALVLQSPWGRARTDRTRSRVS